ncbi:MAG: helix-turn-helix transcriptional regulator [Trichococcus flocculiformis]|nr:XRE family transcriptional regulator [Bacilli bacterium]
MSKNSKGIKRRKSESSEFKQAFEEEQAKLDFADLLFELRQQTGLNQTAFAKKVNKSRSTIARIESARMEPSFSMLEDIAQALGKRVEIRFVELKQATVEKSVR